MIEVRDINIRNTEFLDALNEYKDVLLRRESENDTPLVDKAIDIQCKTEKPDNWLSDEYMKSIISQGQAHDGFPVVLKGYAGLKHEGRPARNQHTTEVYDASAKLNTSIMQMLSARNNALNACYPPGGFISWHNNANAPGYNIIITYSETGEGWFDYWDIDKQERVRIQDKPGWQAKMTYFGPYDDPNNLCYHAAYTDCFRITVAFVFAEADEMWRDVIEDLEDPA